MIDGCHDHVYKSVLVSLEVILKFYFLVLFFPLYTHLFSQDTADKKLFSQDTADKKLNSLIAGNP